MLMHRVNILLDEKAWKVLQSIPKGERSKAVATALEAMALKTARITAAKKMDAIGKTLSPISTEAIISQLRKDRSRK